MDPRIPGIPVVPPSQLAAQVQTLVGSTSSTYQEIAVLQAQLMAKEYEILQLRARESQSLARFQPGGPSAPPQGLGAQPVSVSTGPSVWEPSLLGPAVNSEGRSAPPSSTVFSRLGARSAFDRLGLRHSGMPTNANLGQGGSTVSAIFGPWPFLQLFKCSTLGMKLAYHVIRYCLKPISNFKKSQNLII
jgi:hypothetical protein